jgi:hypothetical protein
MAVSNYSDRRPGDPEVMVELTTDTGYTATGFIDARQQRDDVREAWVDYSHLGDDGAVTHRRDWFPMDDLTVLTIDDVPQGDYVVPPRPPLSSRASDG